MQGILVRIGVDHSYGAWNAPVDPQTGEFVYVPIPESLSATFHPDCERPYAALKPTLYRFADHRGLDLYTDLRCPEELFHRSMHLDPDYEHLTYGDVGSRRGSHIRDLKEDDILVFYSGLRPCGESEHKLIYAIVGIYVVQEVVDAADVARDRVHENAHTRKIVSGPSDIVVRAKPGLSGRLKRCIPIGEYRDRAYRVRPDILEAWGGLSVNDGFIQRSARPPRFTDAKRFLDWFKQQNVDLVAANNFEEEQARVVVIHLRQPDASKPTEMRSDPFWEFGSFGCTGCHMKNIMNPAKIEELEGVRVAFAQGGSGQFRLVMLTPPVRVIKHASRCELRWDPSARPFRFEHAPLLIDNDGNSDFPMFKRGLHADRDSWCGRFSSKFRTRRKPLREEIARELVGVYQTLLDQASPDALTSEYAQTMPYPPNMIDPKRKESYKRFLSDSGQTRSRSKKC